MNTCPISGQPLYEPGQTVHPDTLILLRTKTNNIVGLMHTLARRLAGESRPEKAVRVRTPPTSKPPISLGLLDAITDHQDTIESWAWNIMQTINPSWRMPSPRNWHTVEAIYQQHLTGLSHWTYAPTMIDETTDALHQLNRVAYPQPHQPVMTETQREAALNQLTFRTYPPDRAAELATYITGQNITRKQIYEWARQGRLPKHHTTGRHYHVALRDILHHLHNPTQI